MDENDATTVDEFWADIIRIIRRDIAKDGDRREVYRIILRATIPLGLSRESILNALEDEVILEALDDLRMLAVAHVDAVIGKLERTISTTVVADESAAYVVSDLAQRMIRWQQRRRQLELDKGERGGY